MGRIRQRGVVTVVQEAIAPAAVADEEEGGEEDQRTDGARLPLQQEAEQVEAHEHGVVEPQRRVQRLRDEQHRKQPLEAIHCLWKNRRDLDTSLATSLPFSKEAASDGDAERLSAGKTKKKKKKRQRSNPRWSDRGGRDGGWMETATVRSSLEAQRRE